MEGGPRAELSVKFSGEVVEVYTQLAMKTIITAKRETDFTVGKVVLALCRLKSKTSWCSLETLVTIVLTASAAVIW